MNESALEDVYPLSPLQRGLLFHALYDEQGDVYTVQSYLDLAGPLDTGRMREAVAALLRRHANLRAGFWFEDLDEPVQFVPADLDVPLEIVEDDPDAVLVRDWSAPFDVVAPPLIRFTLVPRGPDRHRLVITAHHLLLDGWSMPVLVRELFGFYDGTPPPPTRPFRDYLLWLHSRDLDKAAEAWREALRDLPAPALLAPGVKGAAVLTELAVDLPAGLAGRLAATAGRVGVTANTVVQTVWGLVVGALTGAGDTALSDTVFGAVVSGRPADLDGVEDMVGLFVNTVPVRVRTAAAETFGALARRVQDEQMRLLDHHHLGLADIQRLAGAGTLFDTLLAFENYQGDPSSLTAGGLTVTGLGARDATHFPLGLTVQPGQDTLDLTLNHRPDLFDGPAAARIATRLADLLTRFADAPELPLPALPPLGSPRPATAPVSTLVADYREPAEGAERLIAGLFAEALGLSEVGADDDFFALGGDSIVSITLVGQARAAGLALTARQIFEHRTVAALAVVVTQTAPTAPTAPAAAADRPLVELTEAELALLRPDAADILPLSPLQAGLLFESSYDTSGRDLYL
ncbi:MAG: condensation domain-containing protein, partial [Streptosporangiaceae bacterium]